jgi:hypothetical protein
VDEKGDVNDLWIACGFDADKFNRLLDTLPYMTLAEELPAIQKYHSDSVIADETLRKIENALASKSRGFKARYNAQGWTTQAFCNPLRPDKHPSASWNKQSGVLYDFGSGEGMGAKRLAQALGVW